MSVAELERYDPLQKRDSDGQWTDGTPGPDMPDLPGLDLEGFGLTGVAEGTFGEAKLGVNATGDVRFAFHDAHGEPRALDLGDDELADMRDAIDGLLDRRDELIDDPEGIDQTAVYDDADFGYDDANRIQLLGNGIIEILFGYGDATDDDPPWELRLDPPYEADSADPEDEDSDDVQAVLDAIDDTLDALDEASAERAAMHAGGIVERKFDPNQLRVKGGEHGGQWTKNPAGALKDELRLAGRVDLDRGERLVSSSRIKDRTNGSDHDLLFAVVHGEHRNDVRIGVIPSDDAGKWAAASKGATVDIGPVELRQARTGLANGVAEAKKAAVRAEKAWNSGTPPTDPKLLGDEPIASGALEGVNYAADLNWAIHINDQGSWDLSIAPANDALDGIALDPRDTAKLLKHLDGIQQQIGAGGQPDAGHTAAAADELGLAGRIDLDPEERLVSSSRISDPDGIDVNFAVVHGSENDVRIGVVPEDASDDWRALNSGDTATLTADELRQMRSDIDAAVQAGRRAADDANRVFDFGVPVTDPKLQGAEPVASGTVPTFYADLNWSVYVDDQGDNDTASWQLNLDVGDGESAAFGPDDTAALLKHLDGIQMQLGDVQAARAYSPESGPKYTPPPSNNQPKGGQFAKGGGRVSAKGKSKSTRRPASSGAKKAAPNPNLSFDGKHGTGYGVKGGDARVRTLQSALNRLGLTDSSGKELAVDGKYGPRTTSAVKKLQKSLGLPVDGKVTPELLKQASGLKQLPPKPPRKRAATPKPATRSVAGSHRHAPVRRGVVLAAVSRALGEHRLVDGRCVTCSPDDDTEDDQAVRALVEALDEISRVRHVRTPAGAKKYGVPIGSPIGGKGEGPHVPAAAHRLDGHVPKAPAKAGASTHPAAPAKAHAPMKAAPAKPAAPKSARTTVKERLVSAIDAHIKGEGDGKPLAGFTRPQLLQAAKQRGVKLDRGESEDSIAKKLIAHARGDEQQAAVKREAPARPESAPKKTAAPKRAAKTASPKARTAPAPAPINKSIFGSKGSSQASEYGGLDEEQYRGLEELGSIPLDKQLNPDRSTKAVLVREQQASLERRGLLELRGGPRGNSPVITPKGQELLRQVREQRMKAIAEESKDDGPSPSGFDVIGAAHDTDALDAAPSFKQMTSVQSVDTGPLADLSTAERASIKSSVASYMYNGYLDMNGSLHAGGGQIPPDTSDETRRKIEDLDKLFERSRTTQDSVLYRGTVLQGEPPDELYNPGFSSATATKNVAEQFSRGYYNGAATGAATMEGTPTVYEFRLPKGTQAVQLSRYGEFGAAEVLLNRGARARKVVDRGVQDGIRRVVYEVIPDGE